MCAIVDQLIILILAPIFFAISFVYSSVGFAGGSSYIAILVLAGVSLYTVPPISLALNIIAASMAFINYSRARYFFTKIFTSISILTTFRFLRWTTCTSRKESCPHICSSTICQLAHFWLQVVRLKPNRIKSEN